MEENLKQILPESRAEELAAICRSVQIAERDFFLKAGEVPRKVAFVIKGLFRYVYTNEKGDVFTKGIILENDFISSYSAMIMKQKSFFSIEALEQSTVLEFEWADFVKLRDNDIFWVQFLLKFVEKGYIMKEKRERDLLLLDAESRYKNFLHEFPGVEQRLTQGIIASYLGIKPETLSRIRSRIVF
jgi:CRP-like cAMP-binding protein